LRAFRQRTPQRRGNVEPDNVGSLGSKIGVIVFAPTLATSKVYVVCTQKTPDVLLVHVAKRLSQQLCSPAHIALGWRLNEFILGVAIDWRLARSTIGSSLCRFVVQGQWRDTVTSIGMRPVFAADIGL
jgi:hypothetical protein